MYDQHLDAEHRRWHGCPRDWGHVLMGERFGGWPWEIETAPADRVLYYANLLAIEAAARRDTAGLAGDQEVVGFDLDADLPDDGVDSCVEPEPDAGLAPDF